MPFIFLEQCVSFYINAMPHTFSRLSLPPPLLVFRCASYSLPIAKLHKNNNMRQCRQYLRRRRRQSSISYLINERCDPIAHLGLPVFPRSLYIELLAVHPHVDVEEKWNTPTFYPALFLPSSPTARTTSVLPFVRQLSVWPSMFYVLATTLMSFADNFAARPR